MTPTTQTLTDPQQETLDGVPGATTRKLSNFGQLGFGINVIDIRPTVPLVDFTYTKGEDNVFHFRQQAIATLFAEREGRSEAAQAVRAGAADYRWALERFESLGGDLVGATGETARTVLLVVLSATI